MDYMQGLLDEEIKQKSNGTLKHLQGGLDSSKNVFVRGVLLLVILELLLEPDKLVEEVVRARAEFFEVCMRP